MLVEPKTLNGISVSVASTMADVEADWRRLQSASPQLPFFSFDWCQAWLNQNAFSENLVPVIVCGKNEGGQTVFILPFQKRDYLKMVHLEWLGQQAMTSCSALFSHDFSEQFGEQWCSKNISALLALLDPVDIVNLRNMPEKIMGNKNPLATLLHQQSANSSFVLNLAPDFETLLSQKRSSRSISKMRRRDERLEASGTLHLDVLHGPAAHEALVEGLRNKNLQLQHSGVGDVFTELDEKYYLDILISAPHLIDVFRLQLDGKTLTTMIGAKSGNTFWLLISALAPTANLQFSPGDYLLRRTIAHYCSEGLLTYDFSLGEQDYKQLWADERIAHYNFIKARSLRAAPFVLLQNLALTTKRLAKQNSLVRNVYFKFRQTLWGKPKP